MLYKRFDDKLVIRLRKGDRLVESVREILKKEQVKAGFITGIGAVNKLDIGIYDPSKRKYNNKIYEENLEILNLSGNISTMDDKLYTHFHISCGKADGMAIGGHLNEALISLTAEIFINLVDGNINRVYDDELGINLIEF